jgi:hypothetical protein
MFVRAWWSDLKQDGCKSEMFSRPRAGGNGSNQATRYSCNRLVQTRRYSRICSVNKITYGYPRGVQRKFRSKSNESDATRSFLWRVHRYSVLAHPTKPIKPICFSAIELSSLGFL